MSKKIFFKASFQIHINLHIKFRVALFKVNFQLNKAIFSNIKFFFKYKNFKISFIERKKYQC